MDPLLFFEEEEDELFDGAPFLAATKCILGVADSLKWFFLRTYAASMLQYAIAVTIDSHILASLLNAMLGLGIVWTTLDRITLMLPLLSYFAFTSFLILNQRPSLIPQKGLFCSAFTILFIALCQFWLEPVDFTSIRGSLMIAAMKQISLAFDCESRIVKVEANAVSKMEHSPNIMPNKLSIFAFVFNPSTVLFGPPIQFGKYSESTQLLSVPQCLLSSLRHLSMAFLFLILSSCLLDPHSGFLPSDQLPWLFLQYLYAQSFRFSHYFVCHFASACTLMGGLSSVEITRWNLIEWPRSMADVVVFWNLPMHLFLHKYIYQRVKPRIGSSASIFLTFAVSAALHGLDVQMVAVLLSLGFCAFSESRLRDRLSSYLSACIRSKKCPENCIHRYKKDHPVVLLVLLLFTLTNIFHLVYLGTPFRGDGQFVGYSLEHLMAIWAGEFRFSGHLLALLILAFSFLIPTKRRRGKEE